MCGILGLVARDRLPLSGRELRVALDSIRHRGPDDEGYLLYGADGSEALALGGAETAAGLDLPDIATADLSRFRCALGQRRLSIIDLSVAGHQPMCTHDRRYWVTYNGEIYNYVELRRELEATGVVFTTMSDTEVLLEAYRAWGEAMLPRLIGMFAFAILDTHAGSLLLARDHFGIKPLYLARTHWGIAFASEIKALLRLPGVGRHGNPAKIYQYLRYGERDAEPATLFRDVERLPAAQYLRVDIASMRVEAPARFWEIDLARRSEATFPEAVAEVRRLFERSIGLHLRSDVPVGSCLSGGLDSSAIVRQVQRLLGPERPVSTFSFIADDPVINEERFVDLITGTSAHKVRPRAAEIADDIGSLMQAQELPFDGLSIYAQFRVFRLAHAAGIKVMLDGQGSDEIFGGYYSLLGAKISGLLAGMRFATAGRVLSGAPQNARAMRARMLATAAGRLTPRPLQRALAAAFGEPAYPRWLDAAWFQQRAVRPRLRDHGRGRDALRQELKLGIEQLTLPELLRYEDYNSMYFSIESRVPFCTPELAEFALSLPASYLISDSGDTKRVFRAAVAEMLPPRIVQREKLGFAVPEREWLGELHGWVQRAPFDALPFLERSEVEREITAALASHGRWPPHVWRLVNAAFWSREFAVGWD
jgi:asparagine synthase (glutamine-hydrolysing)